MALTDVPNTTITEVEQAAIRIRELLANVTSIVDVSLLKIRNLVRDHGREAIAAELGDDAQALLTVYTKLKEAIEAAKEITVEDLP